MNENSQVADNKDKAPREQDIINDEAETRFSDEERKNMRNKVLGWLKSHPEKVIKKPANAVIVPKQKRGFKWPWHKTKPTVKTTTKPLKKASPELAKQASVAPSALSKPKQQPETQAKSEPEAKHIDSAKIDEQLGTLEREKKPAVWPPPLPETTKPLSDLNESPKPKLEQVNAANQPAKVKKVTATQIAPTHDALLTEGHDLIANKKEETIKVENQPTKEIPTEEITPAYTEIKKSSVLKFKLPNFSALGTYKVGWGLFVLLTVIGVLSPLFTNSTTMAKITPTPYAIIGNTVVMQSVFQREFEALKQFQEQQNSFNLTDDQIAEQIEVATVRRTIAAEMASEEGIWVTQSQINEELSNIAERAGSLEQVESTIGNLWGWSLVEYKRYIIRPLLVKRALQARLSEDVVLRREVGEPGDITQFDRYLDSLIPNHRVIVF